VEHEPVSNGCGLRLYRRRHEQRTADAPHHHRDRGHDRGTFRRRRSATRQQLRYSHGFPPTENSHYRRETPLTELIGSRHRLLSFQLPTEIRCESTHDEHTSTAHTGSDAALQATAET